MLSPMTSPFTIFIFILLAAWLLAYIIGMMIGKKDADYRRRFHPAGKIVMMVCTIAVAAIILFRYARGTEIAPYALFILLGLVASIIGDAILAQLLPFKNSLLPGVLAFSVAHICYFIAITHANRLLGIEDITLYPLFFFAIALLFVFGWYRVVRPADLGQKGKRALLAYGLLLVAMATFAVYASIFDRRLSLLALGTTLFLISDMILYGDITNFRRFRYIGDVVWIIYAVGQMAIAFSSLPLL